MTDIAHNMARMRAVLGWTQQKTADFLGTSKQTILAWEKGLHDVPSKKYCKLLERYEAELMVDPFLSAKPIKPEPPVVAP